MTENSTPDLEPTPSPVPVAPKPPSRLGTFFRRALRWTVAVIVVFALGIAAMWATQVRPKTLEIEALRAELTAAATELETLRPLPAENQALREEVDQLRQRLAVVESLVDVASAQVALLVGDAGAARLHLAGTDVRLTELAALSGTIASEDVGALQTRLMQVFDEIDTDVFAAQRDLEVMANTLATMARSLTGD
jgi:hypothetical protein